MSDEPSIASSLVDGEDGVDDALLVRLVAIAHAELREPVWSNAANSSALDGPPLA